MTPTPAASRPPSLVALVVSACVLAPVGVIVTAVTLFSNSFYSDPPLAVTLLGYAAGFALAAIAPVWLTVRSVRARRRFGTTAGRSAGIATGIALSAIAAVICGLPLADALVQLGSTNVR